MNTGSSKVLRHFPEFQPKNINLQSQSIAMWYKNGSLQKLGNVTKALPRPKPAKGVTVVPWQASQSHYHHGVLHALDHHNYPTKKNPYPVLPHRFTIAGSLQFQSMSPDAAIAIVQNGVSSKSDIDSATQHWWNVSGSMAKELDWLRN